MKFRLIYAKSEIKLNKFKPETIAFHPCLRVYSHRASDAAHVSMLA